MDKLIIVVDIECFPQNVIKELAFANPYFSTAVSFKPPYSSEDCTSDESKQNEWATRNIHRINWNSGQFYYSELKSVVDFMSVKGSSRLYAKGFEKCQILSNLFNLPFINLDDLDCPNVKNLTGKYAHSACDAFPHVHSNSNHLHCAHKKAKLFLQWLLEKSIIDSFERIELHYESV